MPLVVHLSFYNFSVKALVFASVGQSLQLVNASQVRTQNNSDGWFSSLKPNDL